MKVLIILPAIAAMVSGLVSLLFSVYGSDIADAVNTGAPLRITVQMQDTIDYGGFWWLPRALSARTINMQNQLPGILAADDPVDTEFTWISLTVEGERSRTVVITDVRAEILSSVTPRSGGTIIYAPAQGDAPNVVLGLDLDEARPRARVRTATDEFGSHFFDSQSVTLAQGEVQTFAIEASAMLHDVTYDLLIEAVVDGKPTEITVENGSSPFHTRGYPASYAQGYGFDQSVGQQLDALPSKNLVNAQITPIKLVTDAATVTP